MPSLKDLRTRINSVKSTQKITSAMKMVAAAKLRRAQENVEAARPYAARMERMVGSMAESFAGIEGGPKMLSGTGAEDTHLIVVATADRGLCGGFNGSIVRQCRTMARKLKADGKTVKLLFVGRKGHDVMKREFAAETIEALTGIGRRGVTFAEASEVADKITAMFDDGEFDVCWMVFNRFKTAMTQIITAQQLIPFAAPEEGDDADGEKPDDSGPQNGPKATYFFEPDEADILADLLPRNMGTQVFQALLENAASEHGARMTAMDSATRNAGDMIDDLTLTYNRQRQAVITRELIEIISGAEAL